MPLSSPQGKMAVRPKPTHQKLAFSHLHHPGLDAPSSGDRPSWTDIHTGYLLTVNEDRWQSRRPFLENRHFFRYPPKSSPPFTRDLTVHPYLGDMHPKVTSHSHSHPDDQLIISQNAFATIGQTGYAQQPATAQRPWLNSHVNRQSSGRHQVKRQRSVPFQSPGRRWI